MFFGSEYGVFWFGFFGSAWFGFWFGYVFGSRLWFGCWCWFVFGSRFWFGSWVGCCSDLRFVVRVFLSFYARCASISMNTARTTRSFICMHKLVFLTACSCYMVVCNCLGRAICTCACEKRWLMLVLRLMFRVCCMPSHPHRSIAPSPPFP